MRSAIESACFLLEEGARLVAMLDAGIYTRPHPAVLGSSLGGHFRHALDHFRNLVAGTEHGDVDYDLRQRQTPVETDPQAAASEALAIARRLEGHAGTDRDLVLSVRQRLRPDELAQPVHSTFGRELAFCVSHAIHHFALMRVIGALEGLEFPATFGVAPSTLAYRSARSG